MDCRIGYDDDFYAWTREQARLPREASSERSDAPAFNKPRRACRDARRFAADGPARDGAAPDALPADCPYTPNQSLDHNWWPAGCQDQP